MTNCEAALIRVRVARCAATSLFVLAAGCGRIAFSPVPGDGSGVDSDDALVTPRCTTWSAFGAAVVDQALSTTTNDDWLPRITPDGLHIVQDKYNGTDFDNAIASRARTTDPFPPVTPLAGADTVGINDQAGQFSAGRERLYSMRVLTLWQDAAVGGGYTPDIEHTKLTDYQHHWVSLDELRVYWIDLRGNSGAIVMSQRAAIVDPFDAGSDVMTFAIAAPGMSLALTLDELDVIVAAPIDSPTDDLDLLIASRPDRQTSFGFRMPIAELNTANDDVIGSWSADATTIYVNLDTDVDGGGDADVAVATRTCLD